MQEIFNKVLKKSIFFNIYQYLLHYIPIQLVELNHLYKLPVGVDTLVYITTSVIYFQLAFTFYRILILLNIFIIEYVSTKIIQFEFLIGNSGESSRGSYLLVLAPLLTARAYNNIKQEYYEKCNPIPSNQRKSL